MTLAAQTLYNTYTTNGSADTFAFNFCIFREAELKVYLDDVIVGSGYSVTGVGTRSGGSVVFDTAPLTGQELLIKLVSINSRTADYQQNGDIQASALNDDLDRLWQAQQYNEQIASQTIMIDDATAGDQVLLGNAAARANKLVGFDSSGDATLLASSDANLYTVSAFMQTVLDDTTASAARTTLGVAAGMQTQDGVFYTATGSAPNYVLTPSPAITSSYVEGVRFVMEAHADGTIGSNTVNVSGLGAKNLKQYDDAGNKRDGVIKNGQVAVIQYDGTDFVILNPLPVFPLTHVRQTVQGGPTSSGLPDFLPATSVDLNLTSNSLATDNLIVSAAKGFGFGSDRIGVCKTTLTWTGLTDSATNYLYVDVGTNGDLTTGFATVAPVYSYTATSGTNTFNMTTMSMYTSGTTKGFRVFVGEAVTSGGAVTSTTEYAYNGMYASTPATTTVSTVTTFNCNIGSPFSVNVKLICKTAEEGYSIGDEVEATFFYPGAYYGLHGFVRNNSTDGYWKKCGHVTTANFCLILNASTAAAASLTIANWYVKVECRRKF